MFSGGNPIDPKICRYFSFLLDCPLFMRLGMSEGTVVCTQAECDYSFETVGGPTAQAKIRLRDVPYLNYSAKDKPYPRGEIMIKGFCVFPCYLWNQEKTQEVIDEEGWYNTGDVGEIRPDVSIKIIDRTFNMVKIETSEGGCYSSLE